MFRIGRLRGPRICYRLSQAGIANLVPKAGLGTIADIIRLFRHYCTEPYHRVSPSIIEGDFVVARR